MLIVERGLAYIMSRAEAVRRMENMKIAKLTYSLRKIIKDKVNLPELPHISLKI